MMKKKLLRRCLTGCLLAALVGWVGVALARTWSETAFENRPLVDFPLPAGRNAVIGSLTSYTIEKGDTLLDIGRWYGLSGKEISDANGRIDWWAPPAGRQIVLPTEHILPQGPRVGIVMNIPEMRIYYYYPSPAVMTRRRRGKTVKTAFRGASPRVVYTFPVGLGRFDWKTPVGAWTVTGKLRNPTWVVPQDIYEEHLERDGYADHVIPGGEDDNPLGKYKLVLSLPEYGIHGTDVPWGVGMNVSHGCIRLYPEDIERLFMKTPVGTPGRFVYQPVKFGWRGDALYVEVHDDLYAVYPGLWNHALHEVGRLNLQNNVDTRKLEQAVEARSGIPTYVGIGTAPPSGLESASVESASPADTPPLNPMPVMATHGPALMPAAVSRDSADGEAAPPGDTPVGSAISDPRPESSSDTVDFNPAPHKSTATDSSIE